MVRYSGCQSSVDGTETKGASHLALETLVNNVGKMPLWQSTSLFLLQDVLRLLLPNQICVPLVHRCLGSCGGGLDLLERPG